jgi:hypothetical protein
MPFLTKFQRKHTLLSIYIVVPFLENPMCIKAILKYFELCLLQQQYTKIGIIQRSGALHSNDVQICENTPYFKK